MGIAKKIAPIIFTVAIGLSVDAAANPSRLAMQWEEGETIHLANQEGAINHHGTARVDLELLVGGKVAGSDTGKRVEHNLYKTYSTNDETTWTNTWNGTWAISNNVLRLKLVLVTRDCQRIKSADGVAPQTLTCGLVTQQIQVACSSERVDLVEPIGATMRKRKLEAWRCTPETAAALTDTPSPWVFGKASCLKVIAGWGDSTNYQKCTP